MNAAFLAVSLFLAASSGVLAETFYPAVPAPPNPASAFHNEGIILYEPTVVIQARARDVQAFGGYIKQLTAACEASFPVASPPETLCLVVALRPGKRVRIWSITSLQEYSDARLAAIRAKLEAVPAFDVQGGPVSFAIMAKIAGGTGKNPGGAKSLQEPIAPQEWLDVLRGKTTTLTVDQILDLVWPDKPGTP